MIGIPVSLANRSELAPMVKFQSAAETARAGLNKEDLAQLLNISVMSLVEKLSGKRDFMLDECLKIKSALVENRLGLEYLFACEPIKRG